MTNHIMKKTKPDHPMRKFGSEIWLWKVSEDDPVPNFTAPFTIFTTGGLKFAKYPKKLFTVTTAQTTNETAHPIKPQFLPTCSTTHLETASKRKVSFFDIGYQELSTIS